MKIALIMGLLGLVLLFATQQNRSTQDINNRLQRGRIPIAIEEAKAKKQRHVTLPAPIPLYASVRSLDEALGYYMTVIAEPIEEHSRINPKSKEIETWYKNRVIEFLSQPADAKCRNCSHSANVPSELLSREPNEFVFVKNGGSVVSDGIQVTSVDRMFPDLKIGQKYLFFLSFDPSTRIGSVDLGPSGIFLVQSDGQVSPITNKPGRLHRELTTRYGNIGEIIKQLKFRRFAV